MTEPFREGSKILEVLGLWQVETCA